MALSERTVNIIGILRAGRVHAVLHFDGCECGMAELFGVEIATHCQRSGCKNCESVRHTGKGLHVSTRDDSDPLTKAEASAICAEVFSQIIPELNDADSFDWFSEWWRASNESREVEAISRGRQMWR